MTAWAWGTSPDECKGREDDREAAIDAAREAAEDGATVYVWPGVRDVDPGAYVPTAVDLIEGMGEQAYHDQPESLQGDPWPDVGEAARTELNALLEPVRAWARKHATPWWVVDGEPEAVPPEHGAAAYAAVQIERPCSLCGSPDLAGGSCDNCGDTRRVTLDVACHELTPAEIAEIRRGDEPAARAAVDAYLALLRAEEEA